jgi:hypothetical protein
VALERSRNFLVFDCLDLIFSSHDGIKLPLKQFSMSLCHDLSFYFKETQDYILICEVTQLEEGLIAIARWLTRPATQGVGGGVTYNEIFVFRVGEESDSMSVGDLLPKSHPNSDHLIHISLRSPKVLVEEVLKGLDHVATFTRELGHLLQGVRY